MFIYLRNNTLSREELNDEDGFAQSIHYGDVLIKYVECLNVSKELLPYIDNKNIVNKFKKFYIQNGDVIIADTAEDETVGKCIEISGIVDHNIISGLHTIPLRPVNKFAYGYLGFYLNSNSYHNQLKPLMQGIKVTSISKNLLKTTTLNYPSNIQEQKKISELFQTLNHLITLHQRKLEKLKIIKKSMLENLFPQNGEKTPKIRFSGFTEDWEQRKLGEVANRFDSTRIPISENLRVLGNTPYYGANGIQDYIDGYTHDGEYVLIAEDGANDLKNYPIRLVKGRIWVNNHAHVIQGIEKIMNNKFINFAMSQVDFESIVVGCGRAKLNAEQLMDICFKIPNKNEQANIGRLFESLDHLITLHQSKLEKLQKIKKSMLESMFV